LTRVSSDGRRGRDRGRRRRESALDECISYVTFNARAAWYMIYDFAFGITSADTRAWIDALVLNASFCSWAVGIDL
jgi:hypothetical protein